MAGQRVWMDVENLAHTAIRSPDHPQRVAVPNTIFLPTNWNKVHTFHINYRYNILSRTYKQIRWYLSVRYLLSVLTPMLFDLAIMTCTDKMKPRDVTSEKTDNLRVTRCNGQSEHSSIHKQSHRTVRCRVSTSVDTRVFGCNNSIRHTATLDPQK